MSVTPRKKAHVLRSFNDAGSGESFEAGATHMLDHATFANYEAAGLVRAHTAETKAAPAKTQRKRPSRAAKKASARKNTRPAETPPAGEVAPGS
jgi:hypothetical protein